MTDEVALEVYLFYLRARVEALGVARPDAVYNEAITDVLNLIAADLARGI